MLEKDFQTRIIKSLEAAGAMVLNVHGNRMQRSGWPDLYIVHPKLSIHWVELKVERGQLSAIQKRVIEQLATRGLGALVLRGIGEGKRVLLQIEDTERRVLKVGELPCRPRSREEGLWLIDFFGLTQ